MICRYSVGGWLRGERVWLLVVLVLLMLLDTERITRNG